MLYGDLMNYVIVYWSRYGNNRRLMDSLAAKLRGQTAEIQVFMTDEVDPAMMPDADVYIFSAPTEIFSEKGVRTLWALAQR